MIACPSDIRAAIRVYYLGEQAPVAPTLAGAPPAMAVVPPPAPSSPAPVGQVGAKGPPPPPERPRPRLEPPVSAVAPPSAEPDIEPETPRPRDAPEDAPQITQTDEKEVVVPRRGRPRMIALTLLDGTTINIPGPPKKQRSRPEIEAPRPDDAPESSPGLSDQLTARDLVSALRAVAHGADASDILGTQPRWEAMFSALLSILLRKGVIADWEFIEEFRKI
jgi:type IV pilus assembly protein PilB